MDQDGVRVDAAELRAVARTFDRVAEIVERAANIALTFGGAVAGRDHVADGNALRRALERPAAELALWSRAAAEIAVGLRIGTDRYAEADRGMAARLS